LRPRDLAELVALAALWGASFLLMRMGVAGFGPVALAAMRVAGAALLLTTLLVLRGELGVLRRHWRPIFVIGITNSALPFLGFTYAALSITGGLSSIFNAASPLFAALIARLWLKERFTPARAAGLAIGFAGVFWTAWSGAGFRDGGSAWAIVACLFATACYGWSPSFAKMRLDGVAPLAIAAGSQVSATLFLALPAILWWPPAAPSAQDWLVVALLAFGCTGLAYLLYFRLIAHIGPANAIAVTFLVPVFAILWGLLVLGEVVTVHMAAGCVVIVLGTALATGLLKAPRRSRAPPDGAG
jgi:drug/metabolite transporter (DMT)-like permease